MGQEEVEAGVLVEERVGAEVRVGVQAEAGEVDQNMTGKDQSIEIFRKEVHNGICFGDGSSCMCVQQDISGRLRKIKRAARVLRKRAKLQALSACGVQGSTANENRKRADDYTNDLQKSIRKMPSTQSVC